MSSGLTLDCSRLSRRTFLAARRARLAPAHCFPRVRRTALRRRPRPPVRDGWSRKTRFLRSARASAISPSCRRMLPALVSFHPARGAASRAHAGEHPPCACRVSARARTTSCFFRSCSRTMPRRRTSADCSGQRSGPIAPHDLLRRRVRPGSRPAGQDGCRRLDQSRPCAGGG